MATIAQWEGPTSRPATNFTTPGVRNGRPVEVFGNTANESCHWEGKVPQGIAASPTFTLVVTCATSATTGDIDLDAEVENLDGLDLDGDSFDTVNSQDNTSVPGTAGEEFEISITLTNDDGLAAGDPFRIRLTRDQASDTAAADLHVKHVELRAS